MEKDEIRSLDLHNCSLCCCPVSALFYIWLLPLNFDFALSSLMEGFEFLWVFSLSLFVESHCCC